MDDHTWSTEEAHADNSDTMSDFIDTEMDQTWQVITVDGTYAEVKTPDGTMFEVHASGNGDAFNHKVSFVLLDNAA